eukprot:1159911-Pelagomonas_calceolata.AAC.21
MRTHTCAQEALNALLDGSPANAGGPLTLTVLYTTQCMPPAKCVCSTQADGVLAGYMPLQYIHTVFGFKNATRRGSSLVKSLPNFLDLLELSGHKVPIRLALCVSLGQSKVQGKVAGRRARVLPSQAKIRSKIFPHRDDLPSKTCRSKTLNNIGKGKGSVGGQAATGRANNG